MDYAIIDYVYKHAANWRVDPVATGRQLQKLRRQHNFTQEDLSGLFEDCRAGTASRVIISMWENGSKMPTLSHIVFLAKLYGCTLDELVVSYQRSSERGDRDQPVPLKNFTFIYSDECMLLHMFVFFCFVNFWFM